MSLSYKELVILRKEVERLQKKSEILDPMNFVERRELRTVVEEIKKIADCDYNSIAQEKSVKHSSQIRLVCQN